MVALAGDSIKPPSAQANSEAKTRRSTVHLLLVYCLSVAQLQCTFCLLTFLPPYCQPIYQFSAYHLILPVYVLPAVCLLLPGHKRQRLAVALLRILLNPPQFILLAGQPRSRLDALPPTARLRNVVSTTTPAGAATTSVASAAATAAAAADPTAAGGRPRPDNGSGSGQDRSQGGRTKEGGERGREKGGLEEHGSFFVVGGHSCYRSIYITPWTIPMPFGHCVYG